MQNLQTCQTCLGSHTRTLNFHVLGQHLQVQKTAIDACARTNFVLRANALILLAYDPSLTVDFRAVTNLSTLSSRKKKTAQFLFWHNSLPRSAASNARTVLLAQGNHCPSPVASGQPAREKMEGACRQVRLVRSLAELWRTSRLNDSRSWRYAWFCDVLCKVGAARPSAVWPSALGIHLK